MQAGRTGRRQDPHGVSSKQFEESSFERLPSVVLSHGPQASGKAALSLSLSNPQQGLTTMTGRFQRYAIYWTPEPESSFAAFGRSWFGATGERFGLAPELAARAVKSPARYGLHATLKAPFRLRAGAEVEDLQNALDAFCGHRRAPSGRPLKLAQFQGYLGLVLNGKSADIDWTAAECVTHFDRYRAPLDGSDRDRRDHSALSGQEEAFLQTFGYPYVLSEFYFHISLAGPLDAAELSEVQGALVPAAAPFMIEPMKIESLSLLGEPCGGGVFEPVSRHRFRWQAAAHS